VKQDGEIISKHYNIGAKNAVKVDEHPGFGVKQIVDSKDSI